MTDNFSTNFSGMFYDPSAAEYYWTQSQVLPRVTLSKTPFTYQTPDIITGTPIGGISNPGDVLLDVWIDVVTPWVGSLNVTPSTPLLLLGNTYLPVDNISPYRRDLNTTFDMSLTDIVNGGLSSGSVHSSSGLSIPQQSYGQIYAPGTFINPVSCHVCVNGSGQPNTVVFTNSPTTLTSGTAILNILTFKQILDEEND
jgi:hypothetical protein